MTPLLKPEAWGARFNHWLASSISNRITCAALCLTTVVALVIGLTSYTAVSSLVRRSVEAELNSQARLTMNALQAELNGLCRELADMAGNSFIANGLVDSLGRDTYLLPFLREHRGAGSLNPAIVLCDFRGRPVAANRTAVPSFPPGVSGVGEVLATGQPVCRIVREPEGASLVLVQPVIFPPTGQPEGALVGSVELGELFRVATRHLGRQYAARLVAGRRTVAELRRGEAESARVSLPLALEPPLVPLRFRFEVGLLRDAAQSPLPWVAPLYLVLGALTLALVLRFSHRTARRLTLPLTSLSRTASAIAAGGSLELCAEVRGEDEVGTLAAAFNEMLRKLRASQEQLESQVAERTRELTEAHNLMESRVELRTLQLSEAKERLEREMETRNQLELQLRQAQKLEAIGTLAGGIAHDFNNILTVIGSYSALTSMQMREDDPLKKNLDQIMTATEKAANLTGSLLAFSRKQVTNQQDWDLNAIVGHVEKFLVRVIGEDIHLVTELSREALPVYVDRGQIEQVLMNLATNARDAMPRGGSLTIRTALVPVGDDNGPPSGLRLSPGRYAVLTVTDSGIGMDRETLGKIFEPFYTTKEVGKGTGLGLSMVYGIVKQNDGDIEVTSQPGEGTCFGIYLPWQKEQLQERGGGQAQRETPPGGTETLLLAEDDPGTRAVVELILVEAGYRVVLAEDGQEAVEQYAARRGEVRLCILDMIMPRKSGKEACQEIRRLDPDARVLFASGYLADYIKNRGDLEEGAELVSKPVYPSVLLKKVREMLDR